MGCSRNLVSRDFRCETCTHTLSSFNQGQCCSAGSRVYVQAGIYDKFIEAFVAHTKGLKIGDPFDPLTYQGPQVSQTQCDRIMGNVYSAILPVQSLTLITQAILRLERKVVQKSCLEENDKAPRGTLSNQLSLLMQNIHLQSSRKKSLVPLLSWPSSPMRMRLFESRMTR